MVIRILYVELYVANIIQATYFYINSFGFRLVDSEKYEDEDQVSVVLIQKNVKLILTSSKQIESAISKEVYLYGDFVKDIALEVSSMNSLYQKAIQNGFIAITAPKEMMIHGKNVKRSVISTLGNIQHTLIENIDSVDHYLENQHHNKKNLIHYIDHIAIAVDNLTTWQNLYEEGLDFYPFCRETIETKHSGMDSIVMNSRNNSVKFVFVSPKGGANQSQIQKYLDYNNSTPGVQHFAFATENILDIVAKCRNNNIEFLPIPDSYYIDLPLELKKNFKASIENIKDFKVLVDKDENGYLLQIFTKPLQTRPTFFCELIQRQGATGFGKNNIMALFKALEKQVEVK